MKKYSIVFLILSVVFAQSTIPNAKVRLLNNETIDLHELTGDVSFVSFWATWCIPCIKEMDVLSEFIEEYDDKVSVILINTDDPGKVGKVKSFVNSKKYLKGDIYHIVMDYNQKLSRRFNAQPIPLSFIVENNNIIHIEKELFEIEKSKNNFFVKISKFNKETATSSNLYKFSLKGADTEGLVYKFTDLLSSYGINVENMDTEINNAPITGHPLFFLTSIVDIPNSVNIDKIKHDLNNLADKSNVAIKLKLEN